MAEKKSSNLKITFAPSMAPGDKWHGIEVYLFCAEIYGPSPEVRQELDEDGDVVVYLKMNPKQFQEIIKKEDLIRHRAGIPKPFNEEEAGELMSEGVRSKE